MPKNDSLTPVIFPMKIRFDEEPTTEFKNDLESINVELIAPIAMEEGLRFAIREGGRTVGAGVVAKITK